MTNPILLHKNLFIGLSEALIQVFFHNAMADKILANLFKLNKRWGKRDRAAIAEAFYDCIRWKISIEFWSGKTLCKNHLYHFLATYFLWKSQVLPNWPELNDVNITAIMKRIKQSIKEDYIRLSYPDGLLQRIKKELPERWSEVCAALNQPAKVVLRCNTLKVSVEDLKNYLATLGILAHQDPNYPMCLILNQKTDVFKIKAFKMGWFELQDAASQKVAQILNPQPGMRVIDACAGAGGKSLHMAAMMQNKGQIIALDIYDWKLQELRKRAKRAGVHCIQSKCVKNNKIIKRLMASADKVLIDAPCSGTGVIKRNPDTKWKLSIERLERLIQNQKQLLKNYSPLVKKGGELVYATCSILPSENEIQIQNFLQEHTNFQLIEEHILCPAKDGYDGFYIAKMLRTN